MKSSTGTFTDKHVYKCFLESGNIARRQKYFSPVCFSSRNKYGQNSFIRVSRVFRLGSVVSSPPSSIIVSRSVCKLEKNFCHVQVGFDSKRELEAALTHPLFVCF